MEEWFLVLGYIVFFLYSFLIAGLGVLLEKKTKINKVICRKITHIISAFLWVICCYFFGYSIHWVIANGIATICLFFMTFSNKFSVFSSEDNTKNLGLFYFGLSTFIVAVICYLVGPKLYLYTGITYYCLALGDGFAPIIAKIFKDKNKTIKTGKTLLGTISVYLISFLSTLIFSTVFEMNLSIIFVLSVAGLTCITEFYGAKGLDNLFIEFSVFGYLVLYHFGLVGLPLQIVLIASPILAILAVGSKAMTPSGGVVAFILFALVGFFGKEFLPTVFIFTLFAISTLVAIISRKLYKKQEVKEHGRKANQIIAVGLFGVLSLIIYYFSKIELFYFLFFLSFVEQFADSMASDIGRLTKRKNVSIITFKPVDKGISGGVSLLGTLCALLGGMLLLIIPLVFRVIDFKVYIAIALISFLGTLVDSILGALFQALYKCPSCGELIESNNHCNQETQLIKGFRVIDNTAVNFIASFVTCLLGLILLVL